VSEARDQFRAGNVIIPDGATTVDVTLDSPLSDAGYEVLFQPSQAGTYDIYATLKMETGFRLTIFPAAVGDLTYSYYAVQSSFNAAAALAAIVFGLGPAVWCRFNQGITSAGGFVSQWADKSGNLRHLKQPAGTQQPVLESDGSIRFPGVDEFLACDAFGINQPETVYLLCKEITWIDSGPLTDGSTLNSMLIQQTSGGSGGVSPQLRLFAGSGTSSNTDLAIGDWGVISAVFNGAASILQINNSAPLTGDAGANNAGGFTVGSTATGTGFSNIQVKEVVLFQGAHDAASRSAVIAHLATVGGLAI
jgi:hypothetical protein